MESKSYIQLINTQSNSYQTLVTKAQVETINAWIKSHPDMEIDECVFGHPIKDEITMNDMKFLMKQLCRQICYERECHPYKDIWSASINLYKGIKLPMVLLTQCEDNGMLYSYVIWPMKSEKNEGTIHV